MIRTLVATREDVTAEVAADVANLGTTLNPASRRSTLTAVGERVVELISEIVNSRSLLEQIASRSYRHINHFDKIVLVDAPSATGHRLTMHLWNPPYLEAERNEELVHDHRFSFTSQVLFGQLKSLEYVAIGASPDDDDYDDDIRLVRTFRYRPQIVNSTTVSNVYEYVGHSHLLLSGTRCREAGEVYDLNYPEVHRVLLPADAPTCTLVLRGPRERAFSHVFSTEYPGADLNVSNTPMIRVDLAERLELVLAELGTNCRGH